MNTIRDLGSPNAEAQALLADLGRKEALIWAQNSVDHYDRVMVDAKTTERTVWASTKRAFWRDVATLLRLETQSDEPAQ